MEDTGKTKLIEEKELVKENTMEEGNSDSEKSKHNKGSNFDHLKELEDLVVNDFSLKGSLEHNLDDKFSISYSITSNGNPFLCMWQPMKSRLSNKTDTNHKTTSVGISLQYLPTFYVVATTQSSLVNQNKYLICLRIITFHGKVVKELKETHSKHLTNVEKLNFIHLLRNNSLKLCKGICTPSKERNVDLMDRTLRLNPQTFINLYLVEQFDEEIIVRSRKCNYLVDENSKQGDTCKECLKLRMVNDEERQRVIWKKNMTISLKTEIGLKNNKCGSEEDETIEDLLSNISENDINSVPSRIDDIKLKVEEDVVNSNVASFNQIDALESESKINNSHHLDSEQNVKTKPSLHMELTSDLKSRDEIPHLSVNTKSQDHTKYKNHTKSSKHIRCKECPYETDRRGNMKKHVKSVHGKLPIRCKECDYETTKKSNMTKHELGVHQKLKHYKCSSCSYSTSLKGNLTMHVKRVHEKIKPYLCELCSLSMSSRQHLKEHIRAVHERLNPYMCELCSFKASTRSILKTHTKLVHNNKKCYKTIMSSTQGGRKRL